MQDLLGASSPTHPAAVQQLACSAAALLGRLQAAVQLQAGQQGEHAAIGGDLQVLLDRLEAAADRAEAALQAALATSGEGAAAAIASSKGPAIQALERELHALA